MHLFKPSVLYHPMTVALLLFLLIFLEKTEGSPYFNYLPSMFYSFNTLFLGMIVEAVPFILAGVILSVFIQTYIREDVVRQLLPKNPFLAMIPAAFTGLLFPVCECAIIPIVRGLIKKGLPQHLGVVLIVSIPIINPIVVLSTFYAFQSKPAILYARVFLTVIASFIIGTSIYYLFRNQSILKQENLIGIRHSDHEHHHSGKPSLHDQMFHISSEFFDMTRYFIVGALMASLFQTFFNRDLMTAIGTNVAAGPAVMMALAYFLSVCSTSDAFLAASFTHQFSPGSIVAFLIFGAMLDVKNTLVLLGCFRFRFVLVFFIITATVVYLLTRLADFTIHWSF